MTHFKYYPKHILSQAKNDEHKKRFIERECLKERDYESLEELFNTAEPSHSFLDEAIEILDIDAIKLALKYESVNQNLSIQNYIRDLKDILLGRDLDFYGLDYIDATIKKFSLSKDELRSKVKQILKLLLPHDHGLKVVCEKYKTAQTKHSEAKGQTEEGTLKSEEELKSATEQVKTYLKKNHLDFIIKIFTFEEAKEFIPDILIQDMKVGFHEVEGKQPLFELDNTHYLVPAEDVMLSRTYSTQLSVEEVREIYRPLITHSNQMIREFMLTLALNIAEGDDIKIIFSSKNIALSHYDPTSNVIEVGVSQQERFSTVSSVFIHEVGHYAVSVLSNNNDCLPFDFKRFLKDQLLQNKDAVMPLYTSIGKALQIMDLGSYPKFHGQFLDYENEAKKIVVYAANLLGISEDEFKYHHTSGEFTEHLVRRSPIGIFHVRALERSMDLDCANITNWNVAGVVIDTYVSQYGKPSPSTTLAEMHDVVMEQYYPQIVSKLTESQSFFLERIGEWVCRKERFIDDDKDHNQLYVELIVRYPELLVAGIDMPELNVLSNIGNYWYKHMSPVVAEKSVYNVDKCLQKQVCNVDFHADCGAEISGEIKYCIEPLL